VAHGARVAAHWDELVRSPDVDVVVVATVNASLAEIASAALAAGKHVLCEKPFGTNAREASALLEMARSAGTVVKVGFTLRHHEGIGRAHDLVDAGDVGVPVSMRAAYGHGGRPGYESEWRGDPALAGGGELLDQGVHLLDLARWFLGDFAEVAGAVGTWSWPVEPLEDNGFALLRTQAGRVASLHTSWTQWKNLFRLEILGTEGLITVEGLGGSYGPERIVHAVRRPEGGAPDEREWIVPEPETAWAAEWTELVAAISEQREPVGSAQDGYEAARLVDAVYVSAREGGVIRLEEVVNS
jgi:predicted dehydrogenase